MNPVPKNSYKKMVDALVELIVQYHYVNTLNDVKEGDVVGNVLMRDHPTHHLGEFTQLMAVSAGVVLDFPSLFNHPDLAQHLVEVARMRFELLRSRNTLMSVKFKEEIINGLYKERVIVFYPINPSYTMLTYTASIPRQIDHESTESIMSNGFKDKIAFVFAAK